MVADAPRRPPAATVRAAALDAVVCVRDVRAQLSAAAALTLNTGDGLQHVPPRRAAADAVIAALRGHRRELRDRVERGQAAGHGGEELEGEEEGEPPVL
eukprot:gene55389-61483_t